jgi:hypothetical protein
VFNQDPHFRVRANCTLPTLVVKMYYLLDGGVANAVGLACLPNPLFVFRLPEKRTSGIHSYAVVKFKMSGLVDCAQHSVDLAEREFF